MTLKIGMIGAGFIGQLAHLMNFIEIKRCQVLALAEFKPELRKKVAARYDIPLVYESHLDLVKNLDIDAVVIVTPRAFTGPTVLDCLEAGKHVLSEKPMVASTEEGKVLLKAANSRKLHYAVGYMKRYDEGVNCAKKYLQAFLLNGELGDVISVYAKCFMGNSYCNPYGHVVTEESANYLSLSWNNGPTWLAEKYHTSYAAYLNTYSHVTNLLRYLFEINPTVEFANLTTHKGQTVVLNFDRFLATLETGKMSHNGWSEEIRITFTDGEIAIYLPPALLRNVPAKVEIYQAGQKQEKLQPLISWSWAFRKQAEAFVEDILEKKYPSRISAEEAYQDVKLVEDIWSFELQRLNENRIKAPTEEIII